MVRALVLHIAVGQAVVARLRPELLLAVCAYVTGLIVGTEASASAIALAVPAVSHDGLTRMLTTPFWTRRLMMGCAVGLANALSPEGWLILDDVLIAKPYAKAIAFCGWDYDHATRHNTFGMRLVVLVWCNGVVTIPLGFLIWQKNPEKVARARTPKRRRRARVKAKTKAKAKAKAKATRPRLTRAQRRSHARRVRCASGARFRGKNELARVLVWEAVRLGIRADLIAFDNWYASRQNIAFFGRLGLNWVTSLKKNTKVTYTSQRVTVAEVAATVPKPNYHYYASLTARARAFSITVFGVESKLTVVKDDSHPERSRTKYLVTNLCALTVREHVTCYRRRWPIEVFFRDCKQVLGLGSCPARTAHAVLTHIVLVCVAYVLLQLLKASGPLPRVSVNRSRNALVTLRLLVSADACARLVRLTAAGGFDPVDIEHLWHPVRTRLPGIRLPEVLDFS